ncbi:MAG: DUF2191 domain-containing protein [Acidimicrobiales bacterium]|nr:MAG: DUF2191 domain-containing protein [Acidimicrobiales bacterium]
MAKTLVDVDEDLLGQAASVLKTSTKRETINSALREVTSRQARQDELSWWREDPLPDLRNTEIMERA